MTEFSSPCPLTTQDHWLKSAIHRVAMVEIPQGATAFLPKRSFINCFSGLKRISATEFQQGKQEGTITVCGALGKAYLSKVRASVDNDLLPQVDIVEAVAAIDAVLSGDST